MSMHSVKMFNRFERFWHWTQVLLIFTLIFTGFAIHGTHSLIDFGPAVMLHSWAAIGLVLLWVFAIFWHLTTGAWRHYVPTSNGLFKVARFYAYGVFRGEHHPYKKTFRRKHNPLQALAYLGLKLVLFPAIWISGGIYLLSGFFASDGNLQIVAIIHTAAAYLIVVFVIAHVYLLTTGHSFIAHVKPMVTGYDDVELTEAELAYLKQDDPGSIRS
ncbi:MAG: cytochrome b/b6 domain-containing protein [Gammaproteobacteria bacterium]|nr:cytochrome b/b6 domain-containing protein [Gammaproteobacteria bacterium]